MDLTLAIPLYNEAQSLEPLMARIDEVFAPTGLSIEVIFVDDGSTDGSLDVLERLAADDGRVRVVSFRRNYGKSAALAVAFARARGRVVATCDADLQDDPGEIPEMVRMLEDAAQPCDLVSGWKKERRDPPSKRWPSKIFNEVVSRASGVELHDMNCGLKVYKREVVEELPVYGEFHRFLPVLAAWNGYRVREKVVKHDPRRFGASKFGSSRFVNGFLDFVSVMFLTGGQQSPIHLFGRMAIALLVLGTLLCLWMFAVWLDEGALRVRPLLVFGLVCLVLGIQFVSIGLLGEMLAFHNRRRDYGIKREIGIANAGERRDRCGS
jgi:glycosyltransferase involved in cell wall biosynthesis